MIKPLTGCLLCLCLPTWAHAGGLLLDEVSWDLIWFGDMPVEQTKPLSGQRLSGEFRDAWVQPLTGSMTRRS